MFQEILIVKPSRTISEMLESTLVFYGYHGRTRVLTRLDEVEQWLEQRMRHAQPLPQLLLLDMSLQHDQGCCLVERLLLWWPHTPTPCIILMTTSGPVSLPHHVPVLYKPFHVHDFAALLQHGSPELVMRERPTIRPSG